MAALVAMIPAMGKVSALVPLVRPPSLTLFTDFVISMLSVYSGLIVFVLSLPLCLPLSVFI